MFGHLDFERETQPKESLHASKKMVSLVKKHDELIE